jgi:hypothetical protein
MLTTLFKKSTRLRSELAVGRSHVVHTVKGGMRDVPMKRGHRCEILALLILPLLECKCLFRVDWGKAYSWVIN